MKKLILIGTLTLALAAQAQASGWNGDAAVGGALGGATGAMIGSAIGGRDAAIIGGLLGGATGVAIATSDNGYRRVERVHYQPAPVYYQPAPVYYRPAPVRVYERYDYAPPPRYGYGERVVYYEQGPRHDRGHKWKQHRRHDHDRYRGYDD
ncbi:MAG: hypothetical protein Q8N54_03950 [Sulfurimicrobium sp.]|jgi:uncharacterized protein YcfJ|nr:hypothetical protein [Sulfurimicrobium sp.]MDP2961888.1 hypothetical protein [Sulfurimicrobium sp.]MDZ7655647.1 hypothetical protein [Sulfurimicrobium sp.]